MYKYHSTHGKDFKVWLLTYHVHIWSEWPVLGEKVQQGERHGEGAQEQVRQGKVGDEDIPRREHDLVMIDMVTGVTYEENVTKSHLICNKSEGNCQITD